MKKRIFFLIYTWFTVIVWIVALFWFASKDETMISSKDYSPLIEKVTFFLLFGILEILIFRAFIATYKLSIERLTFAKGEREKYEDMEFSIILESLLLSNSILLSTIVAIANYYILTTQIYRETNIYNLVVNILAILIFALISYSWPIVNELEINVLKKLQKNKK